jgi:8-oxo-dGTP pyrophosphatase MutT (NUDIX family)
MPTEAEGFSEPETDSMFPHLPQPEPQAVTQTLWQNEWVSLKLVRKPDAGVDGYVYSHETRCQGRIVAVLPYRDHPQGGREYLVKSEMTPCWGFGQVLSAITGGYEGGDIEDDAVREMLEETGYAVTRDELIPLGESYASKSSDTVYTLFSVDLTGREAGEAIGDGSRVEAESAAVWVSFGELVFMRDPQLHVMFLRLFAQPRIPVDPAVATSADTGAQGGIRPQSAGRPARVEVKGFRDLGIVRVTESTLAGEAMLRAESADGAVAEFPASSLHFLTWLPEGTLQRPPEPAAIQARFGEGYADGDDWDERNPF